MLQWADVLKDKSLRNLPYKIELDKRGRLILTPSSNRLGMLKAEIGALLTQLVRGGAILTECSIETLDGVKVADVAWASTAFLKKNRDESPYKTAPEICVEITSPSNRRIEMEEKITLYLAKGAHEVWICNDQGKLTFRDHAGELKRSKRVPRFPSKITIQ